MNGEKKTIERNRERKLKREKQINERKKERDRDRGRRTHRHIDRQGRKKEEISTRTRHYRLVNLIGIVRVNIHLGIQGHISV